MTYVITLVKYLELADVEGVIAHSEQGWTIAKIGDCPTDKIFIKKSFGVEIPHEAEMPSDAEVLMQYAEALQHMTFGEVKLLEVQGDGITISRDHYEWQMRRNGKSFRYDPNYHLFEEVKEVNNA